MIWTITQITTEADSPIDLHIWSLDEHQPHSIIVLKLRYFIGDLSAHDMTDDQGSPNVLKAIQTVSSKAHEVFPDIPIFPAFGNNDIPGHYVLPINRSDPWYKTVLTYWAPLILCPGCPKDVQRPTTMDTLKKTFLDGGYYSANIAGWFIETSRVTPCVTRLSSSRSMI